MESVTFTAGALLAPIAGGDSLAALGGTAVTVAGFGAAGPVLAGLLNTFINALPNVIKPWVPVIISVGLGCANAHANGQPWAAGILPGLTMAGIAARHHDLNMPKAGV